MRDGRSQIVDAALSVGSPLAHLERCEMKKTAVDAEAIAKAERILNRTLVYQAAIAVHELKDVLNLDVEELKLVVAPTDVEKPGSYRIVCTIVSLEKQQPVSIEVVVQPDKTIIPARKRTLRAKSRKGG
jgi:hypothetical protein